MILQLEVYWLCHVLVDALKNNTLSRQQLQTLTLRQIENARRLSDLAKDMIYYAKGVLSNPSQSTDVLARATSTYCRASCICDVAQSLQETMERIMVLSCVDSDPNIFAKQNVILQRVCNLLSSLFQLKWDSPLNCQLVVDSSGQFFNSIDKNKWQKYPDRTWGCYDEIEEGWTTYKVKWLSGSADCLCVHPMQLLPYLNVPNYFLWACIQSVTQERALYALSVGNLKKSLLSLLTAKGLEGCEDNSPFPSDEMWDKVRVVLPKSIRVSLPRVKTFETCKDVIADRSLVFDLQMYLSQLMFNEEKRA